MNNEQLIRMREGKGFIAAMDQSGGSTPGALAHYGITEDAYRDEEEMFDPGSSNANPCGIQSLRLHRQHILAAILFRQTMERAVDGSAHRGLPVEDKRHCADFENRSKGLRRWKTAYI